MIFKWLFLCRLEIFPLFIYIMYDAELHDIQFFDNFFFNSNVYFIFTGFGYGHPNGLHPFMLNPGWLDATYMSYAFPEFFRQQPHNPQFAKGKYP